VAFKHASAATLTINSGAMTAFLNDVSFPREVDTVETTVFGLTAKTFIPGLVSGTLSGSGGYDPTASTGPVAIMEAVLAGNAAVTCAYRPGGSASGQYNYAFSAILTSWEVASAVADWVTISFEMQITGVITPTVI
jgi:hypothetical protein